MQKEYKIPIIWESYKVYKVTAKNLQEAVSLAMKEFLAEPDENYLGDSFNIDEIVNYDYPDEKYSFLEAYQNI